MRDFLIFIPLTFIYLALKSTLFQTIPLPDLPLIFVFMTAYGRPSYQGAVLGFAVGFIEDALNAGVIGSTSFGLVIVFAAVHLLSRRVHFSTPPVRALGAGAMSMVKDLLVFAVLGFTSVNVAFDAMVVIKAAVTGAVAPAVITLVARLLAAVGPRTLERQKD